MAAPIEDRPLSEEQQSVSGERPRDSITSVPGGGSISPRTQDNIRYPSQNEQRDDGASEVTEKDSRPDLGEDSRNGRGTDLTISTSMPTMREVSHHRRQSESSICGKCNQELPGQYVRALGKKWHLECFTCEVSFSQSFFERKRFSNQELRIVVRLSHPSSSLFPINPRTNTLCARRTTSAGSTSFALNAAWLYGDLT